MRVVTVPSPHLAPARGLAALPEAWIPPGRSRAVVGSPWGGDYATVTRTPSSIEIDCDSFLSPDLVLADAGNGRVKIDVDMPWPLSDIHTAGPVEEQGGKVLFREEPGSRTGEIYQDGLREIILLREPGKEPMIFTYRTLPGVP